MVHNSCRSTLHSTAVPEHSGNTCFKNTTVTKRTSHGTTVVADREGASSSGGDKTDIRTHSTHCACSSSSSSSLEVENARPYAAVLE